MQISLNKASDDNENENQNIYSNGYFGNQDWLTSSQSHYSCGKDVIWNTQIIDTFIDTLVMKTPFFNNTRDDSSFGHNQKFNTEIRFIILFVAEDGEALYSQQKKDLELTVAQIISSLMQNSGLNWRN